MYQRKEGFDAVLVAPWLRELTAALARATNAANARCRNARVELRPEQAPLPDGRLLATLADEMKNNLLLRDFSTGAIRATWTLDRRRYHARRWLRLIAFSPDSRTLAASERDGVV